MVSPKSIVRKKMSSVDTAWLRMDTDTNLMMIVGVAMLEKPVSSPALKRELKKHFLCWHPFRSHVVREFPGAWWQEQEVDLDRHVIRIALPANPPQTNKAALEALVGQLSSQPLDPDQPLWQMHLVDHYIGPDGRERQALIIRIHHCIADGMALVRLFMSMFDQTPTSAQGKAASRSESVAQSVDQSVDQSVANLGHEEMAHEDQWWAQILDPVTRSSIKAIETSSTMLGKYLEVLAASEKITEQAGEQLSEKVMQLGHSAGQLMHDLFAIGTMQDDTPTRLKGELSGDKRVAWSEFLPLFEVKTMAQAYGCSINDILMSSVAGALRQYLLAKGEAVESECEMRAMVPVNLRTPNGPPKLGNEFGLVPLVLPIGIEDPVARLLEVQRRMSELKGSYTALVALSMLGVLGATPKQVQLEVQDYFTRRATAVMSNVPGPQTALYLAGSKLEQVMFWVPQSGSIGLGISILSYNGGVQFGIVTDAALADDPQRIISQFQPEFEKLVLLMLMEGDW
jgi:diacylglycerol O-acyltransferase / wax synthase